MLTTRKPRQSRRNWLIAGFVLAAALATAVLGGAAQPAAADSPATAVLDWNKHALDALANGPTAGTAGAGLPAYVQGIHLAMVQGAVYDAVNAIDGSHEPYLDGLDPAPSNASKAAAVATAAHDTLVEFLEQIPTPLTTAGGVCLRTRFDPRSSFGSTTTGTARSLPRSRRRPARTPWALRTGSKPVSRRARTRPTQ